jgi:hypothetical protein
MPYTSLAMQPGINAEKTALLNSASWSYGSAVRFRDGLPEKTGGFFHLNNTALTGICTGMHAWADHASNRYIACGTDQRLELLSGGVTTDITPLRKTSNVTPAFSTQTGSTTVTVTDTAHGADVGDWINIYVPVSVGGIILQGFYLVQTVVDANNYTITSASPAVSAVSGGLVPDFATTHFLTPIEVTLAASNQMVGSTFTVQVTTTVGGVTILAADYSVIAPVTANTFFIDPGVAATSSTTGYENGGNARIEYLVATGLSSAIVQSGGGWGVGDYGAGPYGLSYSDSALSGLRQWFLDNFGEDLVGNYTGSPIYLWVPPVAGGNVAIPIDTTNFPGAKQPPTLVTVSFVAGPQQMIIALGCDTPGTGAFNPLLVRWCDQDDYTDWQATALNQAGSFPISEGSKLVGGLSAPNFTVLWTDVSMWLMTYLGGSGLAQLVWGFNKVAGGAGLLSARSCAVFRNLVFYASPNGVYMFDGNRVTLIPCSVWDKFWKNLDRQQVDKVNMEVNSYLQELSISFPSATGDGDVDSRITYNIRENTWTYDDAPTLLSRTAWIDENVYGAPCGTDLSGYIQQHDNEGYYDADGAPLPASIQTGWFAVQEGTLLGMMERLEADLIVTGGNATIYVTVYAQDYAIGPVRTYGPYAWTPSTGPPRSIVRARGRFMSIKFASVDLGVFWRLGNTRYVAGTAGRRP